MDTKEVIDMLQELYRFTHALIATRSDLGSSHLAPFRGNEVGEGSTLHRANEMIKALSQERVAQMRNPRVLAENLSDKVLSVTYDKTPGGEYIIVKLDCGTVRVFRFENEVRADLYEPVDDEFVGGVWETPDNLLNWHFND